MIEKLLSGKFIFTVITAIVFAYSVFSKILTADQTHSIILTIVAFYFYKKEDKK